MAEAENTDVGDPYLQNLNIRPARQIRREAGVDGSGKERIPIAYVGAQFKGGNFFDFFVSNGCSYWC